MGVGRASVGLAQAVGVVQASVGVRQASVGVRQASVGVGQASVLQLAGQLSLQQCLHQPKQIKMLPSLACHVTRLMSEV